MSCFPTLWGIASFFVVGFPTWRQPYLQAVGVAFGSDEPNSVLGNVHGLEQSVSF